MDKSEYQRLRKWAKGKTTQEVLNLLGEEKFLEFMRIGLIKEKEKQNKLNGGM